MDLTWNYSIALLQFLLSSDIIIEISLPTLLTYSQVVDQASVYDTDLTLVQFSAYLELLNHCPSDSGYLGDFFCSFFSLGHGG